MALARLWQRLPLEVEETVLSFLPVPDLCRWRTVCKRWNRLISRCPKFFTLCLQNAGKDSGYIVARVIDNINTHPKYHGWIILDIEARRWYRIKHDHAIDQGIGDERISSAEGFVATDGGLVCECVSWGGREPVVSIFNPLVGTKILRLPDIPERCETYSNGDGLGTLNFVAHDVDDSFKVFYINQGIYFHSNCGDSGEPEAILRHAMMPVYDSTTSQWLSSANPLMPQDRLINDCECSVMFRGLLFVLFMSQDPDDAMDNLYWLQSYNIVEDMWQDTGVRIRGMLSHWQAPQLIVSDDRLFLLAWVELSNDVGNVPLSYYACEILLVRRTLSVVFQITSPQVQVYFHVQDRDNNDIGNLGFLQAFGFKNSLILMSRESGITMVYNLASRSWDRPWDRLPRNPMMPLPSGCALWYGKPMNLRLPTPSSLDATSSHAAGVDGEPIPP